MSISSHNIINGQIAAAPETFDPSDSEPSKRELGALKGTRLLATEAMRLLIRLDGELRAARAQFNQDWFRRLMRIRPKAVLRLRRRWAMIYPPSPIGLGKVQRRYHANLARYLYSVRKDY